MEMTPEENAFIQGWDMYCSDAINKSCPYDSAGLRQAFVEGFNEARNQAYSEYMHEKSWGY
jgi:ribosome modulation factor